MKYINKNTGDSIESHVYSQLSESAKLNFIASSTDPTVTIKKHHQINETKSDSLSVGDAVAVVALSPLIILKGIFG